MKMKQAMLFGIEDIRIVEREVPMPGEGEVLIRNCISTTCGTDVKNFVRGYPLLTPPHPYGHEYSGVVAAVGAGVTEFAEGDRIACHNTAPCGTCYACKRGQPSMCQQLTYCRGTYAEYVLVPAPIVAQNMFHIPDTLSHKAASLLEPLSCAVYGIENCPIALGDMVVINGAGPIGLMFARLAVLRGAKVLVTDLKQSRLDIARKLGVWKTICLQKGEDGVEKVRMETEEHRGADVVIEATGVISVWESSIRMARKGGFILLFGGTASGSVLQTDATLLHYSQLTIKGVYHTTPACVAAALELLKLGVISEHDFIQNEYPLEQLEQAIREHRAGNVIKNCIVYPE